MNQQYTPDTEPVRLLGACMPLRQRSWALAIQTNIRAIENGMPMKLKYVVLLMVLSLAFTAKAQVIFVAENSSGNGSGSDWNNAASQSYLNSISTGSGFSGKVYVKARSSGTYNFASLKLMSGALVKGGYPISATGTDTSGYNPIANVTNISSSTDYYVYSSGPGGYTIKGFKISSNFYALNYFVGNGNFITWGPYNFEDMDISGYNQDYGIVYLNSNNYSVVVNITNCYIHDNYNGRGGAAVTSLGTGNNTVNIKRSTFSNNVCGKWQGTNSGNNGTGESQGAVICMQGSTLNIDASSFCDNHMSTNGGGGGAIGNVYTYPSVGSANITITNSSFSGNYGVYGGGAISLNATGGSLKVSNTNFYNNRSTGVNLNPGFAPGGGAIELKRGVNSTITNCNFYGNTIASNNAGPNGANSGGAIGLFQGTHTITNCVFDQNTALQAGGAINANEATVTVTTSTFKNNKTGGSSGSVNTSGSDFGRVSSTGIPGTYTVKTNSYVQLNNATAYGSGYSFDASTVYGNTGTGLTVTSTPCPTSINPVVVNVQGSIWNDADGSVTLNGSEAGTNAGGLFVNLVDASGTLITSAIVAANGTYSLTAPASTTGLKLVLSTSATATTPGPLPTGWVNTDELAGAGNSAPQGTTLGQIELSTGTAATLTGQSFGIEQTPTTGSGTATVSNAGGTNPVTIPPSAFTSTSPSTDTAPGSVTAIRITAFPSNVTSLTINGVVYTASSPEFSGGSPTGVKVPTTSSGVPSVPILVDPTNDSAPVSLSFVAVDNAGKEATNTGTATLLPAPDLTPIIYARPSTLYNTTNISVVVEVFEVLGVASSGLITVRLTKDTKLSLVFDPMATLINGHSVQNGVWSVDGGSDMNYYILTTNQVVGAGDKLSFGFTGVLSPGSTSGKLTVSAAIVGGSGGEVRVDNNVDADKIDYFQQ